MDVGDFLQGEACHFESGNLVKHRHLGKGIIPVSVLLIGHSRHQQTLLLIEAQGLDGDMIHGREHTDFVEGSSFFYFKGFMLLPQLHTLTPIGRF